MRKFSILAVLLLLLPIALQAQEEIEESIPYVELGANFAVPELPAWEKVVEGETVLFSNANLNAQIYVAAFDTQDVEEAIASAIEKIYPETLPEALVSNRIGRNDGTWEYRLFNIGDTSISAYGLLKSNRSYVVVFIENSADYAAYNLAIRGTIVNAEGQEIPEALEIASRAAIQTVFNPDFAAAVESTSNPAPDNPKWILADYEGEIATASYLNDNIVYISLVEGDAALAPELSNAFDTVFLGFVITPNNTEYLYLGMAFAGAIFLILIGSFWLRYQNLQKDLQMLEQLAAE